MREIVEPTKDEHGNEQHPAFGLMGAHRIHHGPPGATLFDSDIRHQHTVRVKLTAGSRHRVLNHDFLHGGQQFVEVEMSEAQWASFVSSMGIGSGVPVTIRYREGDVIPELPFEPRLKESMAEVRDAAEKAARKVQEAFDTYAEKKSAKNLRNLKYAIANMPSDITFAAKSLSEHTENVVQRARADIEAIVLSKAEQLGLEPGDVLDGHPLLGEAKE